jgi:hypothetical protein
VRRGRPVTEILREVAKAAAPAGAAWFLGQAGAPWPPYLCEEHGGG